MDRGGYRSAEAPLFLSMIRRCGGMVDTGDLKSPGSNTVPVRVRSPAPSGTIKYRGVEQLVARRAHNPEVGGSSPPSATIRKVPNSLRIGYFLFVFTPEMFDFSKAQKALFLLIYQQFINKCYLKALKTPKVGDWGLFFRSPYIYYKNISYRYIKIIPQSPKIPRKP